MKLRNLALPLAMLESIGWTKEGAASVAGSEDQPDIGFEFRVPGFELEGTRFQKLVIARWAHDMRLREWSQRGTTCVRVVYLWALPFDVQKVFVLPQQTNSFRAMPSLIVGSGA